MNELFGFLQRLNFPHIEQAQVVLLTAVDARAMTGLQVEINDGEAVREALHQREKPRRKAMDAREGKEVERDVGGAAHDVQPIVLHVELRAVGILHPVVGTAQLARRRVHPPHQPHRMVEEQKKAGEDGTMDQAKFIEYYKSQVKPEGSKTIAAIEAEAKKAFENMDVDQNGKLDLAEASDKADLNEA